MEATPFQSGAGAIVFARKRCALSFGRRRNRIGSADGGQIIDPAPRRRLAARSVILAAAAAVARNLSRCFPNGAVHENVRVASIRATRVNLQQSVARNMATLGGGARRSATATLSLASLDRQQPPKLCPLDWLVWRPAVTERAPIDWPPPPPFGQLDR